MGTARQFGLLLWKNFIIQRRKICVTVLEIGIPTLFALILIAVRQIVIATPVNHPTTYSPYNISLIPNNLTAPGHRWKIYYTPNTSVIHDIMNKTKYQLSEGNQAFDVKAFDDEDSMVRKLVTELQTKDKCSTLAAIVFTNMPANGSLPDNIIYKIRLSSSPRNTEKDPMHLNPFTIDTNWMTEFQFPLFQKIGPREKTKSWGGKPGYMREGFLALQYNIDQAIVKVMNTSGSTGDFWVQLQRYPYPIYKDDNFILVIQKELPYFIMLSFVFCALHIVKDIVHEKERRLKETMKLMGLSSWLHWSAWFVKSLLFLLISVGIMTLFFCINTGQYGSVIGATDPSILFVFLLVFAISTICFSFAVSVFFNKANSAAAAGGICFFFSYTPYYFLQLRYDTLSMAAKLGSSLISNVAMSYGCQIIGLFEGTGVGVQWSNINQTVSVDDNLTLLHILLMLLLDAVLYLLLALYIEAVWPGEFGMPQPWYFPVLPSFWCKLNSKEDDITDEFTPLLDSSRLCRRNTDYFETEPVGLKAGIKIRSLTKVFGKGPTKKVAVDGMTLNMYEGQICALLGHNGAGKTTTMSMLTGFFPPTSGTALINDFDIMRDICRVRESLGLCPQHDVLFDTLTVEEHLIFFAKLKDCPSDQVSEEVERMLEAIGLCSKRRALAKTLSGGMKRKLSVGIALIAKSKIVILDEPTSGMDPNARRQMWELLLKQRGNRTILLSTHFMDEADYLGDRIAIMAEGVVQCCGTPLFLKNRYGAGYHMVMVKEDSCDVAEVTRLVTSFVPDARLETNISAELSYILPHESKDQFEALFTEIEARKTDLKVTGYGASVTTMEEVFLRVGESADENLKNKLQNSSRSHQEGPGDDRVLTAGFVKNTGLRFYLQQFYAMFVKRMLHTFRNWMVTLAQLAVPLIFTIIALVVLKTLPHPEDSPSLSLNMTHFDANDVLYTTGYDVTPDVEHLAGMYAEQFRGSNSKMIYLNNLTDMSIDDYIVMIGNESLARYNDHLLIAAEFVDTVSNNLTKIISHFNGQAFHTPAISLNAVNNAILRFVTTANHSIRTINHPLPRTVNEEINQQLTQNFEGFSLALNTVFGMSFLASSFVLFLVKERTIKAKHCQFASGVHLLTFWGATLLWDLINYLIPCVLLLVTFAAFGVEAYVADGRLWYLLLLFLLYGWAVLPCMYVMSFLFTVPSSGLVWLTMFNIISGIATILAVNILMIPQLNTMDVAKALEWLFLTIMPNFCLGQGMTDLYSNYEYLSICNNVTLAFCRAPFWNPCCKGHCGDTCVDFQTNYLAWEYSGIGRMLVFLAIQGCFYLCILFLMESSAFEMLWYRVFARKNPTLGGDEATERLIQEDSDVALERQRILTMSLDALYVDDSLVLRELTKHYNGLTAVDRVSVGIKHGECFGLLGINGAGKTSTFKMLTGDEIISSGTAYLGARDIKNNLSMVRQQLGYCPQFDALIDQLTGRETLTMYARLRGVKGHLIPDVVQDLISSLLLEGYADQLVATYSGGNKRKLSTAVSLVGDPPIIFLDEPSTGMDPVARRLLWDTLSRIRSAGRTLVLTSHSMEECEALCTRLAIMVNGQFKCLGSPQHLKTKFGQGYTLIAKVGFPVDGGMPDARPLMDFIESTFPGSVLKDVHQGMVHYHIADTSIPWGRLFGTMQRASRKYNIEDYSVSQTSLELVFINFARSQLPPVENMAGCCKKICAVCRTPPGGCLCCLCQRDEEELETIVGSESQTSLNA